jgi:hypothetical protein
MHRQFETQTKNFNAHMSGLIDGSLTQDQETNQGIHDTRSVLDSQDRGDDQDDWFYHELSASKMKILAKELRRFALKNPVAVLDAIQKTQEDGEVSTFFVAFEDEAWWKVLDGAINKSY